jgi:isopenicillin N synthase-like dioxygenase
MFELKEYLKLPPRNSVALLPRIDMSILKGGGVEALKQIGQQLCSAFYHVGFATLVNHDIEASDIQKMFKQSKMLFELPLEDKRKMAYTTTARNRGYIGFGQETLEGTGTACNREAAVIVRPPADAKESFDVGSEQDSLYADIWPGTLMPAFKQVAFNLRSELDTLHGMIMQSIALNLDLEKDYFTPYFENREYSLRLIHYPQISADEITHKGQKRAGTHTDYNQMTLLLQDQVGGLQVLDSNNQWIDVKPESGAIIVNTGDLMERWSNGLFCSTVHRVMAPESHNKELPNRYSMAYFVKPNRRSLISCLSSCQSENLPAQYPTVECFDYVDAAFKKAGNENIAARDPLLSA